MIEFFLSDFMKWMMIAVGAGFGILMVVGVCVHLYCDAHQCSCHDPECGGGCPDARDLAKTNIWEDKA